MRTFISGVGEGEVDLFLWRGRGFNCAMRPHMYYYIAHGLILMMSISKRLRRNQRIVHKGIETCQRNIFLKKDLNFLDFLELII